MEFIANRLVLQEVLKVLQRRKMIYVKKQIYINK